MKAKGLLLQTEAILENIQRAVTLHRTRRVRCKPMGAVITDTVLLQNYVVKYEDNYSWCHQMSRNHGEEMLRVDKPIVSTEGKLWHLLNPAELSTLIEIGNDVLGMLSQNRGREFRNGTAVRDQLLQLLPAQMSGLNISNSMSILNVLSSVCGPMDDSSKQLWGRTAKELFAAAERGDLEKLLDLIEKLKPNVRKSDKDKSEIRKGDDNDDEENTHTQGGIDNE